MELNAVEVPIHGRGDDGEICVVATALVDESDAPLVLSKRWNLTKTKRYCRTAAGRRHCKVSMHRLLIPDVPKGMEIDHINGNGLDNRRENLRVVTTSVNQQNRHAPPRSKAGYRGVRYEPRSDRWTAQVTLNRKNNYLGTFDTPEEAAAVVVQFRRENMPGSPEARYALS